MHKQCMWVLERTVRLSMYLKSARLEHVYNIQLENINFASSSPCESEHTRFRQRNPTLTRKCGIHPRSFISYHTICLNPCSSTLKCSEMFAMINMNCFLCLRLSNICKIYNSRIVASCLCDWGHKWTDPARRSGSRAQHWPSIAEFVRERCHCRTTRRCNRCTSRMT